LAHSSKLAPPAGFPEALILADWPEAQPEEGWEAQKIAEFQVVQEVVRAIRNLRAEKKVTPGKRIGALIAGGEKTAMLKTQTTTLTALAYLDPSHLSIVEGLAEKPQGQVALVVAGVEIYLPLAELVDREAEKERLQKELESVQTQINRLETLLGSSFAEKAPSAVVAKERDRLAAYKDTEVKLRAQVEGIG
jgi:valyl-tRNA synthetase